MILGPFGKGSKYQKSEHLPRGEITLCRFRNVNAPALTENLSPSKGRKTSRVQKQVATRGLSQASTHEVMRQKGIPRGSTSTFYAIHPASLHVYP